MDLPEMSETQFDDTRRALDARYGSKGEPDSIVHEVHSRTEEMLAHYDAEGCLDGVLFYFPVDVPAPPGHYIDGRLFHERAGNITILVDPKQRGRGIATRLLRAALQRWPISLDSQSYTPQGRAFIAKVIGRI
jgi:GNAT superfamily N-acetyltransferase